MTRQYMRSQWICGWICIAIFIAGIPALSPPANISPRSAAPSIEIGSSFGGEWCASSLPFGSIDENTRQWRFTNPGENNIFLRITVNGERVFPVADLYYTISTPGSDPVIFTYDFDPFTAIDGNFARIGSVNFDLEYGEYVTMLNTYSFTMEFTNIAPTVDEPTIAPAYQWGELYTISWTIHDLGYNITGELISPYSASETNRSTYTIFVDDPKLIIKTTNVWNDGNTLDFSFQINQMGEYDIIFRAADGLGLSIERVYTVSIENLPSEIIPEVNSITGFYNEDLQIQWQINDSCFVNPSYIVSRNGVNLQTGTWINGDLVEYLLPANTLIPGTYTIRFTVYDGEFTVYHDVTVVLEPTVPSVPQFNPYSSQFWMIIGIFGASVMLFITWRIVVFRRDFRSP